MPSIDKTIIFFLPQVLATGCRAPVENFTEGAAANAVYASELYQTAVEHANQGDRKAALAALSTALDAGYQTPSSILSSTRFRPLRGHHSKGSGYCRTPTASHAYLLENGSPIPPFQGRRLCLVGAGQNHRRF
jgi:hypothetical protein